MGDPDPKSTSRGPARVRRRPRDAPPRRGRDSRRREVDDRDEARLEKVRARTRELEAAGMPNALAVAVAQGRVELNDALERMARRNEVERLMEEHDLNRALATQVVLGHADLGAYLRKRRFQQVRETGLMRSVLDASLADGLPRVFGVFGGRKVEATVTAVDVYEVTIQPTEGDAETLHKLAFKFAYAPDDWKRVKKATRKDKAMAAQGLRPAERPQDRYTCSDRRLFDHMDDGRPLEVTLLEGEIITGQVAWFSRFEFGVKVKGDVEIVVFRHALHRVRDASKSA